MLARRFPLAAGTTVGHAGTAIPRDGANLPDGGAFVINISYFC
jgi:hypothetical protein